MRHISKLNRKINGEVIIQLFRGWSYYYESGMTNKNGDRLKTVKIKHINGSLLSFKYVNNKLTSWNINDGRVYYQNNINDFLKICDNEYKLRFKLKYKNRFY